MFEVHAIPSDPRFQNLTGKKFSRLKVISYDGRLKPGIHLWKCRCQCGTIKIIRGGDLRLRQTRSCGCLKLEQSRVHGASSKKSFSTWKAMMNRCYSNRNRFYHRYGGRGIIVCQRWHNPNHFLSDMGDRPSPKHSIDRINNDGNYEPGNCRWATVSQQQRNKVNTLLIEYEGRKTPIIELSERFGIRWDTLRYRIRNGWRLEDALRRPVRNTGR